jgi:transcriptional regulator with XRE-family HTH domain
MKKTETIKAWRERHALSQSDLAACLGVDVMTVSRWERGAQNAPPFLRLALMAIDSGLDGPTRIDPIPVTRKILNNAAARLDHAAKGCLKTCRNPSIHHAKHECQKAAGHAGAHSFKCENGGAR